MAYTWTPMMRHDRSKPDSYGHKPIGALAGVISHQLWVSAEAGASLSVEQDSPNYNTWFCHRRLARAAGLDELPALPWTGKSAFFTSYFEAVAAFAKMTYI